jgi:hypothetical protein
VFTEGHKIGFSHFCDLGAELPKTQNSKHGHEKEFSAHPSKSFEASTSANTTKNPILKLIFIHHGFDFWQEYHHVQEGCATDSVTSPKIQGLFHTG